MHAGGMVLATRPAACVFCDIVAGQVAASVVYEDDLVLAFMDIAQINPGHALVIPKAHYAALSDLPEVIGAHLFTIAQRLAGVVQRSGVRCEGVNLFLSDGAAAGQEVFHCHLHVLPRFRGDAFRVEPGPSIRPPRGELDAVAQRLSAAYCEAFPADASVVE